MLKRLIGRLDAFFNRLYGSKYNPLYQSGTLIVVALALLLLTGIYLLIFYRISRPYESVLGMNEQVWAGRWIRAMHRYASDAAIVLAIVHALRMFIQSRLDGPRAKAWWSGVLLFFTFLLCGWTGYVMVWDAQAHALAVAGARLLDVLPVFSQSIIRTFAGDRPIPGAFFFLNYFAHIALPIGVGLVLWIHLARIARPVVFPPRGLLWGTVAALTVFSVVTPIAMGVEADPLRIPDPIALDVFYNFWLPWAMDAPPLVVWAVGIAVGGAFLLLPWLPGRPKTLPGPSYVKQRHCTGCEQCSLDCPYDAIRMVPRVGDGKSALVGLVDPALCVSCGICAGSCAPMLVGPPGRTGRDQLAAVKMFIQEQPPDPATVVIVACSHGSGGVTEFERWSDAVVYAADCAGSIHTSLIEYLVRSGFGGVMVVSCPPRDCWNREGPIWLEQRMFHDREAELQARVDRDRVRLVFAGPGERAIVARALEEFRSDIEAGRSAEGESSIDLKEHCDTAVVSAAEGGS